MEQNPKRPTIVINDDGEALQRPFVDYIIDTIFSDPEFKRFLRAQIDGAEIKFKQHAEFITLLHVFFERTLPTITDAALKATLDNAKQEMEAHFKTAERSMLSYQKDYRENPEAVFWPDPTRKSGGKHLRDVLPIAKRTPFVNKMTPIGSAGSCFAFEIAKNLQRRGFNYVVGEAEHDGKNGVWVDGYSPDEEFVRFSATWGLIFNTPSLRQLAERAFGLSRTPPLLNQMIFPNGGGHYMDPFREGVAFASPAVYEADKENHAAAVKRVLTECEVFIVTLGLNECWRLQENKVALSRNPHNAWTHLLSEPAVLTIEENVSEFEGFLSLVRKHNPNFKVVLSLSPIPLIATHRMDQHVITANTHSKAVLRVAAEEIVSRNEGVFYFPSYEFVINCADNPWEEDQRHVTRDTVTQIMEMFDTQFVEQT